MGVVLKFDHPMERNMKNIIICCLVSVNLFCAVYAQESTPAGDCQELSSFLTPVFDFPKPGINFISYANLLERPDAFHRVIQKFADRYRDIDLDGIVGLDARGFVFGAALAYELKVPFVMIRKAGKLPRETRKINYALEYGTASFEIEVDSIKKGDQLVVIDDVLATGGTADAAAQLVESLGGEVVEAAFLIEIPFLKGRERLGRAVYSLITY